jgi:hypothetical protein
MSRSLRFQAVSDAGCERWSRPKRFDFFERLPTAPVADTEFLHLSHYCPIVVLPGADGPRVAILLDPSLTQSNPIGHDGRWRVPYSPMALRSLPFWPGSSATEIEIALELAADDPEDSLPMRDNSGRPSDEFAAVVTLIERLQLGMRRLSEAAKVLVAADLLVPLVADEPAGAWPADTGLLTVSPTRLAALSPARAAALSTDRCTPLDLATACLFSQRLLHRRVKPSNVDAAKPGARAEGNPIADQHLVEPLEAHMRIDNSPLFSFELFERLGAKTYAGA